MFDIGSLPGHELYMVDGCFLQSARRLQGNSGGYFSTVGKGSIHTVLCNQNINTKSFTEAELVPVDDYNGHALWIRFFLLTHKYKKAKTIVILQDNQSAVLLE